MQVPKAERLSQWGSGTEIIYSCRHCGTSFGFYGEEELFCHNCGTQNDWQGMPFAVSPEYSKKYHGSSYEEQKAMMDRLDKDIIMEIKKDVLK